MSEDKAPFFRIVYPIPKPIMETNSNSIKFISLAEASKISGYHQDYLGYLARVGKLEAQKIARNWVTTEAALKKNGKAGRFKTGTIGCPRTAKS